ncbi:helix-turn-helix domain-containing protein [Microbacterium sp. NPDC089189]|uniref:TetR/AcrR family transcriptional regulator n=1 Tax=Microbacterium sp. NPDC089189 TaxID=3154972 RepID=UPI0034434BA3
MAGRGSYAKGIAKREEILDAALQVVAREGYRGASVREIADAVGLSQAGLLHYFDSKEELFVEILRTRDAHDLRELGPVDGDADAADTLSAAYRRIIERNSRVPGLVHLFARLSVDAADPAHPAHDYFVARNEAFRRTLEPAFTRAEEAGTLRTGIPVDVAARTVQAAWDGAQLQWMLDATVDMAAIVAAAFDALAPTGRTADA